MSDVLQPGQLWRECSHQFAFQLICIQSKHRRIMWLALLGHANSDGIVPSSLFSFKRSIWRFSCRNKSHAPNTSRRELGRSLVWYRMLLQCLESCTRALLQSKRRSRTCWKLWNNAQRSYTSASLSFYMFSMYLLHFCSHFSLKCWWAKGAQIPRESAFVADKIYVEDITIAQSATEMLSRSIPLPKVQLE